MTQDSKAPPSMTVNGVTWTYVPGDTTEPDYTIPSHFVNASGQTMADPFATPIKTPGVTNVPNASVSTTGNNTATAGSSLAVISNTYCSGTIYL